MFLSAAEVFGNLALNSAEWDRVEVGPSEREGIGPNGRHGTLVDNLIVLRRRD